MRFRKRNRHHESEVYTDSLNDILFILLMLFLIAATVANPNVVKVTNPRGTKDTKAKQNIMLTITKDQQFYIGQKLIDKNNIDSALGAEIERWRHPRDTPTIVINADTAAFYGEVFHIMRIAKRDSAKIVANVK